MTRESGAGAGGTESPYGESECHCLAEDDDEQVSGVFAASEAVVVTEQGPAIKTCAANVRRIPESERWDAASCSVVSGWQ